jgi:predicted transposase/invertase (TIGR01784 family)
MERLNPLNDYIFQKLLGEKGDEEQLLSFLNAVLERTDKDKLITVEILTSKILTAEIIGDKMSILDIVAKTDNDTRVNIEVQLRNYGNMDKRSMFYWGKEYTRGLEAGQDYILLPNVIAINLINFDFIPLDDFHTIFHIWEDKHRYKLNDVLEIHFIEMPKFMKLKEKDMTNPLHRWLTFFNQHTNEKLIKELINMDAAIRKVDEKMSFISSDKEALRSYQMREMALSDYTSGMNFAKREGRQEGIITGRQEREIEMAKKMLLKNKPLEEIIEFTELTEQEIKDIQKTLQE